MSRLALLIQIILALAAGSALAQNEYQPEELAASYLISDNQTFKEALKPHIQSLSEYKQTSLQDFDFLCMGEYHSDSQRKIYADLLSELNPTVLALEDKPESLGKKLSAFGSSRNEVIKLLGADIRPIFSAIRFASTEVIGVESTSKQDLATSMERIQKGRQRLSRDGFIAFNLEASIEKKTPVVALYGAKHCGNFGINFGFSVPFYRLLKDKYTDKKFQNLILIDGSRGIEPLQAYVKAFGFLKDGPIVIVGAGKLDPKAYNYRSDLKQLFEAYDAIIVAP